MKIWDNGLSYTIGEDNIPTFDENSIGLFEPEDKYDARIMQFLKVYDTNMNVSFLKDFAHLSDEEKYAIILALEYNYCKDVFAALEKVKKDDLFYDPYSTIQECAQELEFSELMPYIDFNRLEANLNNEGFHFLKGGKGAIYSKP